MCDWQVLTGGTVGTSQRRGRGEAMSFIPWLDVIGGTPPGWREASYAWKVPMSRCDTQTCSFLF